MTIANSPRTSQCVGVSPRVSLLTLSTVRALRGCVTEKIKQEVDSGEYLWVFDFSLSKHAPDSRSHALRFWVSDVANRHLARQLSVDEVVSRILPPARAAFHPDELCLRFSINRVTLFRMRRRLGCGRGAVKRKPLVGFLKSRWLGAAACTNQTG